MTLKELFHSEEDREILAYNGFSSFDAFWEAKGHSIEKPNYRRGGWSGIILHELRLQNGLSLKIIVKRQENHNFTSFLHPVKGVPTFFREYKNICRLERNRIPTVQPLYYGERRVNGNIQAVLAVRFLEGYRNLDEVLTEAGAKDASMLVPVFDSVAGMIVQIHSRRIQYSSLYGKHVFVKTGTQGPPDVRLIDLEKMHLGLFRSLITVHDLAVFIRRTAWPGEEIRDLFLKVFLSKAGLAGKEARFHKAIRKKIEKKRKTRQRG